MGQEVNMTVRGDCRIPIAWFTVNYSQPFMKISSQNQALPGAAVMRPRNDWNGFSMGSSMGQFCSLPVRVAISLYPYGGSWEIMKDSRYLILTEHNIMEPCAAFSGLITKVACVLRRALTTIPVLLSKSENGLSVHHSWMCSWISASLVKTIKM